MRGGRAAWAASISGARGEEVACVHCAAGDCWNKMFATSLPESSPQELMYLMCIKRLKDEGRTIVTDLGDAAPAGTFKGGKTADADAVDLNNSSNAMGRRMEQVCSPLPRVVGRRDGGLLYWPRKRALNHTALIVLRPRPSP